MVWASTGGRSGACSRMKASSSRSSGSRPPTAAKYSSREPASISTRNTVRRVAERGQPDGLQRDVGVPPALAGVSRADGGGQRRPSVVRSDDLVDHADLDRLLHSAGDALVLGGQLGLDLRPDVV